MLRSLLDWSWLPGRWIGVVIGVPVALVAGGLLATAACRLIEDTYWLIRRRFF